MWRQIWQLDHSRPRDHSRDNNFEAGMTAPRVGVGGGGWGYLKLYVGETDTIAMSGKGVHLCLMVHKYQEKVSIFV